jgi:hypothetical protein
MATTLGLPRVDLTPDDLPEPVRELHAQYIAARSRAGALGTQLDRLPWGAKERGQVDGEHQAALAELTTAHQLLSAATIVHGRALADYASVQFIAHIERVRALLAEAEQEARAAASSASVVAVAVARRGQPVLDVAGSDTARRSDSRAAAMNLASRLRDVAAGLPEGV